MMCFFVIAVLVGAVLFEGAHGYPSPVGLKRLQHRSAMLDEFYPQMMLYIPSMTFTSDYDADRQAVATNPKVVPNAPCISCDVKEHEADLEETTQVHITAEEKPAEEELQPPTFEVAATQRTKTKQIDEPEDEKTPEWSKNPSWNVFFPMTFGHSYPGGATAIANSFSTGKGGVATSHATAFGNGPTPHFKNSDWKSRSQSDN